MNIKDFEEQLKKQVVGELKQFGRYFSSDEMEQFDLGCFPWHGTLEISFLTKVEPGLGETSDVASWRLYNFTSTYSSNWPGIKEIGKWMQNEYDNKNHSAQDFFDVCVRVAKSLEVTEALKKHYRLSPNFHVSVFDTDNLDKGNLCDAD